MVERAETAETALAPTVMPAAMAALAATVVPEFNVFIQIKLTYIMLKLL